MAERITPEQRKIMEKHLEDFPIDPAFDSQVNVFDGDISSSQLLSRSFKRILDEQPKDE